MRASIFPAQNLIVPLVFKSERVSTYSLFSHQIILLSLPATK